jgi:hypothetical protein
MFRGHRGSNQWTSTRPYQYNVLQLPPSEFPTTPSSSVARKSSSYSNWRQWTLLPQLVFPSPLTSHWRTRRARRAILDTSWQISRGELDWQIPSMAQIYSQSSLLPDVRDLLSTIRLARRYGIHRLASPFLPFHRCGEAERLRRTGAARRGCVGRGCRGMVAAAMYD